MDILGAKQTSGLSRPVTWCRNPGHAGHGAGRAGRLDRVDPVSVQFSSAVDRSYGFELSPRRNLRLRQKSGLGTLDQKRRSCRRGLIKRQRATAILKPPYWRPLGVRPGIEPIFDVLTSGSLEWPLHSARPDASRRRWLSLGVDHSRSSQTSSRLVRQSAIPMPISIPVGDRTVQSGRPRCLRSTKRRVSMARSMSSAVLYSAKLRRQLARGSRASSW